MVNRLRINRRRKKENRKPLFTTYGGGQRRDSETRDAVGAYIYHHSKVSAGVLSPRLSRIWIYFLVLVIYSLLLKYGLCWLDTSVIICPFVSTYFRLGGFCWSICFLIRCTYNITASLCTSSLRHNIVLPEICRARSVSWQYSHHQVSRDE